ncbi:MAG: hypothetical protein A2951_01150 [Candidatus Buchananbacteria bacterium RIFCSPLOWO2_01_FULL_56_15]|uniref:Large ribosomal subunit protein bL25 n=2 Tax=Candidatus Buchananiibacteriota TaxID=1817903 RepID=A0A1G1YIQ2_9BACT|nr:MAG: hypothetical protein A3J59_04440 [Candidatus Buchananbacteria bacterium RIFCSPHIGHO2_02_FULL_56_16]OGY54668.1 MAG: hypothetical protein A2951_01150 [Candidatus Buchananbacteria bacterium RIFCSPLOWO2_01_FULL_56_15]
MTDITLQVQSRSQTGKQVARLREEGVLPAVVYGRGFDPKNISVDSHQFAKVFEAAGESTLLDLSIDQAKPVKVLIQDIQRDPLTHEFLHVDFHQVRMDEKLKAEIILKFMGEPPAVKELSGILVTTMSVLPVECLPADLVHEIEVNLSSLKTFNDAIHVADIAIPKGLTVMVPADEVIALIQEPRAEKEFEAIVQAPAAGEQPTEAAAPTETPAEEADAKK